MDAERCLSVVRDELVICSQELEEDVFNHGISREEWALYRSRRLLLRKASPELQAFIEKNDPELYNLELHRPFWLREVYNEIMLQSEGSVDILMEELKISKYFILLAIKDFVSTDEVLYSNRRFQYVGNSNFLPIPVVA